MTGKTMRIWLSTTMVIVAGGAAIAQDSIDEDSLFALEEITLTDAVEGDLPLADSGDDDLLAELMAGDSTDELIEEPEIAAIPTEAFTLDESVVDDLSAALEPETVVEVPEFSKLDETRSEPAALPELESSLPEVAESDFPLEDEVGALGLPMGEPETAVDATPITVVESVDPIVPLSEDGNSLDDLLSELSGTDESGDGSGEGVDPAVMEPEFVEEKGAEPKVVMAPEGGDSLDDLLGGLDESEIADMGTADADESIPDDDDLSDLADLLVDETESDLGDVLGETAPVVEVPILVAPPVVIEELTPPAPIELVDEPEVGGYVDDMALDDNLFESLASEANSEVSAVNRAVGGDAGERPAFDIDALVDDAEARFAVEPTKAPAVPTLEPLPVPTPEPVAIEEELFASDMVDPVRDIPLTGKSAKISAFDTAERLKRIAGEAHAIESIQDAEQALAERNYLRSIALFEEALEYLPRRAELVPARTRARDGLGGAYYLRALSMEKQGELEKAKAAALKAVQYGYKRGEKAVKRIQDTIDTPPPPPPKISKDRWDEPDYLKTAKEISVWLKRGRQAYLTGEYDRAILNFESVLARDPENKEATRLIRSAAQKQYDRASSEFEATRSRMVSDVRKTWNPRNKGIHEAPIDEKTRIEGRTTIENVERTKILKKMNNIRIPEVDFRQANIRDVVDFLHSQSVEFDPSKDADERKGVNIILKLEQKAGSSAPAAALDPFAAPDDGFGGGAPSSGDETLVTFSALDISLQEALDIVVDVAGLKYLIRGSVVMILPKGHAVGEIELRMYDVLSTAIDRIQALSSAVSAPARQGNDDFLAGGNLTPTEDVDLKKFFTEMGVEWPDKSSIQFVRGLGKLVVANTLENLTRFERVLNILNVVPYQIEIEARFVEVAQTDVDSLGLEWMLTDNWELLEKKGSENIPLAARERVVMNANSGSGGFTKGNRFMNTTAVAGNFIADDLLSLSGVLTNPELTVVLHALQQRGHTDLLSAPKITTQSGQAATIKVVTEYIYPTEFETEGIGGNNNNNNNNSSDQGGSVGAVVTPSSFETREVGVILEVMPTVSPEGQMINLQLSPEVVSEPTWRNYGSSYTSYDPNGNPVTQELNMEQPFFHTRHLSTNLLIYNGATVVMGGMITEVRTDVDDKVPILGDIPIIGRLFRSRYESSEKRNLLIFVTARLVDPSGRALDNSRFGVDSTIAERIVAGGAASDE